MNFVDAWSVDEIVMLDVSRAGQGNKENFLKTVTSFAKNCFVPLSVGGGVRSLEDVKTLMESGADKVVVNTGAINRPELITEIANTYGAQCAVVSIDTKKVDEEYHVFSDFGKKDTAMAVPDWIKKAEEFGAGEFMLTSIDRDGSLFGYDNQLCAQACNAATVPVLICGGAGNWNHFVQGYENGADAVCTANIYHFTESSIASAKKTLQNAGFDIRKAS